MSKPTASWKKTRFLTYVALPALIPAAFGHISPASAAAVEAPIDVETIVVTGTRFNAELAPAKASLDAMEPQTIINKSYIENFLPPQADYVTILAIAPGMTGTDINGPGLSDGNVKNTLRGFPDGDFVMAYDGIPFGDTNGPSHHSVSYFPASTIGSALVDRGPGNAGNLGAATYGGTIKLFSEDLIDQQRTKAWISEGSFGTRSVDVNLQSGAFGTQSTRVMANFENDYSNGALTEQNLGRTNMLLKVNHDFGSNWKLTLFGDYEFLIEHLNDNNGATPAQTAAYGKDYAMQNTNPALATYYQYNKTRKTTDMEYARLQGTVTDNFSVDNTAYTYGYTNHTFTATNIEQTAADIANGVTEGLGTVVGGTKYATDIPGYTKINEYRVVGDILRTATNYNFGSVTGQLRVGLWTESQATIRSRYDFDVSKCNTLGIDPFALGFQNASACWDASLSPKGSTLVADGYAEYNEHSAWYQYEPFAELEIHPFDGMTITPGIKYIDWLHKIDGLLQKTFAYAAEEFTTTKTLPFVEVNYKLQPSWSVYFQYAQGIYIPDISNFENKTGVTTVFPAPETTTNYQVGTVFYSDNFSFDGDLYYIPINNNYSAQACNLPPFNGLAGETCFLNTGTATYKGIEGEATYAFTGALQGFQLFASGSVLSAKSEGLWLKQVPPWTLAAGLIYSHNGWKFAIIDKSVGPQYQDNTQTQFYKVGAYSTVGLNAGYSLDKNWEVDMDVSNMLNSRKVVSITENDKTIQTNRMLSLDQYYFQAPASVMFTLKMHY